MTNSESLDAFRERLFQDILSAHPDLRVLMDDMRANEPSVSSIPMLRGWINNYLNGCLISIAVSNESTFRARLYLNNEDNMEYWRSNLLTVVIPLCDKYLKSPSDGEIPSMCKW